MNSKDAQDGEYEEMDANVDNWIKQALDSVGIKSSAYLPVMGGLLVHVTGEGIIWVPRARVAGILSKSGLFDTMLGKGHSF